MEWKDTLNAHPKKIDILFTHDIHSYLETETPDRAIVENCARLKYLITQKKQALESTFVVDGGDFAMGTLYQTIFETSAAELTMLGRMGFDATTIGNHEFDYRPQGFAKMLYSAVRNKQEDPQLKLPALLSANIDWNKNTSEQNKIVKAAMDAYGSTPYRIVERGGIRAGIFGVMGEDSVHCAPLSGLRFEPIIAAAKVVVTTLKEQNVDIIICLSHSGIWEDIRKSEDEQLAMAVSEIDVIVSGHTHSMVTEPIVHGDTYIVCAGAYCENAGELVLTQREDGRWKLEQYQLNRIAEVTGQEEEIVSRLHQYRKQIDEEYLSRFDYSMEQVIAKNPVSFGAIEEIWAARGENAQGLLIADAYLHAAHTIESQQTQSEKPRTEPLIAIVPSGIIRTAIPKGAVTVADVFRVSSLGIGPDGIAGYPLVSMYLTGKELKDVAEIDATLSPYLTGTELFPSGMGWNYNHNRLFLNRVSEVWVETENNTKTAFRNHKLYRVIADLYTCQMLGMVKTQSHGLLNLSPKDAQGNVVTDYEAYILRDCFGNEVKAWKALADYLSSFPKEQGVAVITKAYAKPLGRKTVKNSRNPVELLKNPNRFFAAAVGIGTIAIGMITGISLMVRRVWKHHK